MHRSGTSALTRALTALDIDIGNDFIPSIPAVNAKGFWEDDARVKIKVAAEVFPFRFVAITRSKDGWKEEDFGG